ncbi:cyclin-D-binding Myb-like transcription factor 1 [Uloborus diversus]|uniref:cyclin-D-binding Myb-like transcription factor 1 n=1 Tax=Uloborus diversus TaxID=327109 RepID=UPI002409067B|nr:cyclin-D-binding Myb-like transcription factor 1 [Uloborus diversus]
MAPMLQTLEMLPQNIQLTNPQAFLLTTPAQPTLPLTTALPPNQIIIHTMTPEGLHQNENVSVELNPSHVIINTANAALTSLASTQIPSAPPSPAEVESDSSENESSSLMENSFEAQAIDENGNIHQDCEIDAVNQVHIEDKSTHYILSDPMLAANRSPEGMISDMEPDKIHTSVDNLDSTPD